MSDVQNASNASGFTYRRIANKDRKKLEAKFGKTARISRNDYELIFCKDLKSDGRDLAGLCSPSDKKIYISTDYSPIEETLLHEILHAEIAESGFQQMSFWSGDLEEILVESMSKSISSLFSLKAICKR